MYLSVLIVVAITNKTKWTVFYNKKKVLGLNSTFFIYFLVILKIS
jgi:hypothetical protein